MQDVVPLVLNALTLISILMIVALGLAIVFGLMNIINMAHGEFVTLGAFTLSLVQSLGGSYWMALFIAPLVGGALGAVLERGLIRFLYERPLAAILATWGVSLIVQQVLQLFFGAAPIAASGPFPGSVSILGATYPGYRLLLIGLAFLTVGLVIWVMRRTRFGLDLRAVIQNREVAQTLGIDSARVATLAFAGGTAIAALAGVLVAPLTKVIALMGANYLAPSFFVEIVGGAGSIPGVIAGSTVVGGLETVLNYQVPVTLSQALVLITAVVIVRFRPRGLIPA
jgi:branched-chain amino acid transport system permease protein/urea transport system permease protein